LVTLVGVGGVGKTRVALAAAEQVAAAHDLGVFVDLSEVRDESDVLSAVALAMGLSTPTMDSVGIALSGRRVLMVLDNCEHVLEGVADLVEELLEMSPSARGAGHEQGGSRDRRRAPRCSAWSRHRGRRVGRGGTVH
jgi:non-specific serine/threonine protein kinase